MRLLQSAFLLAATGLLCATPPAAAMDRDEAARVRTAVARGQILPLPRILAIARARVPGSMLEVELDQRGRRLVYEVKILTRSGRVVEIAINARNGRILSVEDD
ncbi:hypothetical protein GRI97_12680 [Altererythrobacter xixiisoli]|uniref:PepSY domain-containing protein n=1 Tax=Croceibacterium xixiisoli TaxID=1476466 RepID=A0A6I4TXN0_9SPHN|nr:PepSY domain-containing protein [Croceibacterium xixiisoli]MXO99841.1 hypothetical protein [Croceibacterium xixiisoli]